MRITLYEKPTCSKCRQVVALLQQRGIHADRVNYYLTPLDRQTLARLLQEMGARPREILRTSEPLYKKLGLHEREIGDEELIDLMVQHPDLIQRPILEVDGRAVLGRPIERVTELLDEVYKDEAR